MKSSSLFRDIIDRHIGHAVEDIIEGKEGLRVVWDGDYREMYEFIDDLSRGNIQDIDDIIRRATSIRKTVEQ